LVYLLDLLAVALWPVTTKAQSFTRIISGRCPALFLTNIPTERAYNVYRCSNFKSLIISPSSVN
jgi:hypothetical protein